MPLWRDTDALASRPTFFNQLDHPPGTELVFIDATEADNPTNKRKGFKGPGWHLYRESFDSNGQVRYHTELLVALRRTAVQSGDATDDLVAPDVDTVVSISVHPANQTTVTGGATFSVTAALTPPGTVTFQWQLRRVGTALWENVVGATAATLALTARTVANTGDRYRVVVGGAGSARVTSNEAVLTFGT